MNHSTEFTSGWGNVPPHYKIKQGRFLLRDINAQAEQTRKDIAFSKLEGVAWDAHAYTFRPAGGV